MKWWQVLHKIFKPKGALGDITSQTLIDARKKAREAVHDVRNKLHVADMQATRTAEVSRRIQERADELIREQDPSGERQKMLQLEHGLIERMKKDWQ